MAQSLGNNPRSTPNPNNDGSIIVAATLSDATDGTDTLYSVEKAIFNNSTPYTLADLLPPVLSSTFPSNNGTGVSLSANIVLSFNETVVAGTGNIVIHNGNGTVFATIAISDSNQVAFSGSQVTLNPIANLVAGASYYVTLAAGVIKDANGNSFDGITSSSTLNFTTAPAVLSNQPPDAKNDQFSAQLTHTISGNVLADNGSGPDFDPENDPLTVDFLNNAVTPAGGHVTLNNNGSFQYTAPNSGSSDSFTYTLRDNHGNSDVAIVNIGLSASANQPPAVAPVLASRSMNVGDDLSWSSLFTVTDPENDPTTLLSVDESNTSGVGSWYIGNTPLVGQNYVSPSDFANLHYRATGAGAETVYFQAREQLPSGGSQWSDRASVNVNVNTPNNPIYLSIVDNSILEGAPGDLKILSFAVNLSGPGAGSQAVSVLYATQDIAGATSPALAGQDYIATSSVLVIPAGQTSGTINVKIFGDNQLEPDEVFRLALSQPSQGVTLLRDFATGFVDNDDQAPNHYPTGQQDVAITAPNTPITMDVLSNDSDLDGDPLHVSSVFGASSGATISVTADSQHVLATPDSGFSGIVSFFYVLDDGRGGQSSVFDHVIVSGDGSPPISNSGTAGNDTILGGGGNDILSGGFGDDAFVGGPGSDRIDGGPGIDYLDLRQAAHGASIQFSDPQTWDDGDGGHDILTSIEGVFGTSFDDLISGNYGQVVTTPYRLYGNDGNDRLDGSNGDDVLDGGAGNDTLTFQGGQDTVFGGSGNDQIYSQNTSDTQPDYLDGGPGDDIINSSGASADNVFGGSGNDSIRSGNGDTISGGSGNDTFFIGSGGSSPAYHATIIDLAPGDKIEWSFQTPIISPDGLNATWFAGPITIGSGATTLLDHVEFATSATESTLYIGFDSNPGADFILSLPNTVTLNQLQVENTNSSDTLVDIVGSAPTGMAISNNSVLENRANGTAVGSLSASDPDLNETFTYTLLNNAGGRFAIDGSNLVVASALDYESAHSYDVTVRVTDSTSLTLDKIFTINLIDVNEGPPAIVSNGGGDNASISMVDDTTAVTTVSAVDPDTGEGLSYFIAGGVDQNAFQIDALTGALSFKSPPDDDAPTDSDHNNSYVVQIGVSDGEFSDLQTFTVNVTDASATLAVTITGIAQESSVLTAVAVANDSDATVSYQWQANHGSGYANIAGATGLSYLVQEGDEGATLKLVATSTDSDGSGTTSTSLATVTVTDISPTLTTPVISGTSREGQTLTATAAVANDSDATVGYQWQANHGSGYANIAGATSLSYLVQEGDEGATLRLVATSTDSDGSGTTSTSLATATVTDISPTLTTPVISGTARQGQTLTATAAVANDSDATVSYQWQANHGSGYVNIAGATSLAYLAQEGDEGATLRLVATSTDSDGSGTTSTSLATATVTDISPTLTTPVISGTARQGQTLTATAAAANDSDATVSYQWQANHGSGYANIAGATSLSYLVQEGDEGATLKLVATSTDSDGSGTTSTSLATATVTDIAPTLTTPVISGTPQQGQTLTATAAVANDSDVTVTYQWQANHGTGYVNIAGATSLTYLVQEGDEGATLKLVATSADSDGSGTTSTSLATATVIDITPTLTTPVISGTPQQGQTLTATAAVANDGDVTVTYQWQANHGTGYVNIAGATSLTYLVQEGDEGATLKLVATSADSDGSGTTSTSLATATVIDITPTLTTPVISGTAQQGQTLTASAAVANDSDATVSYQWQANHGSGYADIAGATSLSYMVQVTDEGATLKLVATSADSDGSGTTSTSLATATVIDTQAPNIINDNPLAVTASKTGTVTSSLLSASDNISTGSNLHYTVTSAPSDGTLLLNNSATTSFTQDDINNNRVTYHETATVTAATTDQFFFRVSDAAGNATAVLPFQINIALNHPPVLTLNYANVAPTAGQVLQAANLFSATDAENDPLTYYLYDATAAANSGHFVVNGTAMAAQSAIPVTQAQLAQTSFQAGTAGTSDDLLVVAYDGQAFSPWAEFHVNVAAHNTAPVLTLSSANVVATAGQVLQAANLFSATDAENDPLTYYLYDATPAANSGHFVVNGTAMSAQTAIPVTQAQLAQTSFQAGTAGTSDDLLVVAYDGQAFSPWAEFHVNVAAHNTAPVLTLSSPNVAATAGQVLQAANLFSATDAENDPLTYYLYDATPAANSGHFVVNGTAMLAQTAIPVTQAQLVQTSFQAGTAGTSDDLLVVAYDGQAFSPWAEFHVNVAAHNTAPVLTLSSPNVAATAGQVLQAANLFGATDADNDPLTYYLYDATSAANSGHFVVNGTAMSAQTAIPVTQAQLAQTSFQAGAAGTSDDLLVTAYDGQAFSPWAEFYVNVASTSQLVQAMATASPGGAVDTAIVPTYGVPSQFNLTASHSA